MTSQPSPLRRARARVANAVRIARDRRVGAADAPIAAGLGENRSRALVPDEELWRLGERYRGRFEPPPVSYGTVRDLADSRAALPGLSAANADMKDVQRCWALKAVVGSVEPGARVVEIGAGEPLVAGVLARLGYEVVVVDPYDGSGNGPLEYRAFRRAYPELSFIRDRFPPHDGLGGRCAAVYSISVLEHVPLDSIEAVASAARGLVAPDGLCIHAVDHVVRGWGADEHRERLERIVRASAIEPGLLDRTLAALDDDPDAYFVSAEAHDRWRGALPYDEYPMRRIASVNLLTRG
jgi:Methyltransferase domain